MTKEERVELLLKSIEAGFVESDWLEDHVEFGDGESEEHVAKVLGKAKESFRELREHLLNTRISPDPQRISQLEQQLAQLRDVNGKLVEVLRKYGRCDAECAAEILEYTPCDCGYVDALKEAEKGESP